MAGKTYRIIAKTVLLLFVLLVTGLMALQTTYVQSKITARVSEILLREFGGSLSFSSIRVRPFNAVLIKDACLTDEAPYDTLGIQPRDTIIRAKTIYLSFGLKGLAAKNGLHLRSIYLKDAFFALINDARGSNIERVFRAKDKRIEQMEDSVKVFIREHNPVFSISAGKIKIENAHFIMKDYKNPSEQTPGLFNAKDMDSRADLKAGSFRLEIHRHDFKLAVAVSKLDIRDKCGYAARNIKFRVSYENGRATINKLSLDDNYSRLRIPYFKAYLPKDEKGGYVFNSEIRLGTKIKNSIIAAESASFFTDFFKGNGTAVEVKELELTGYISELKLQKFIFKELSSGIYGNISGSLTGIGTEGEMFASAQVKSLDFTTGQLDKLIKYWVPDADIGLKNIAKGRALSLKGEVDGPFNRLKGNLSLYAKACGSASAAFDVRNILDTRRKKRIKLKLSTDRLDLGRLLGNEQLEAYSLRAAADVIFSQRIEEINASVSSADPWLDLDLRTHAKRNAASKDSVLVEGVVRNLRLRAFLPESMPLDAISLNIKGSGTYDGRHYDGALDINDIKLQSITDSSNIGNITLRARDDGKTSTAMLSSKAVNAIFMGSSNPVAMIKDVIGHSAGREASVLFGSAKPLLKTGENYKLEASVGDLKDIMPYFAPGLYIAEGSEITLAMDDDGQLEAEANSEGLAMHGSYIRGVCLRVGNAGNKLGAYIGVSEIGLKNIALKNNLLVAELHDNHFSVGISFDNHEKPDNNARLDIQGSLYRDNAGRLASMVSILPSKLTASGIEWNFTPASIKLEKDILEIEGFRMFNDGQSLSVNGMVSPVKKGSLTVDISDFRISTLNSFLPAKFRLDGIANGKAVLNSPTDETFGLLARLNWKGSSLGGQALGDFNIGCSLDEKNRKLDIALNNDFNEKRTLNALASYHFDTKNLNLRANLDSLGLKALTPVLSDVFKDIDGFVSGSLYADGNPASTLKVNTEGLKLENGLLLVNYTQCLYLLHGALSFDNNGLHFDDVDFTDRFGSPGKARGGILCDDFKDWRLDARLSITNGELININRNRAEAFYGNIFGSGNVNFSGPFGDIMMEADAVTTRESRLYIPLGSGQSTLSSNLLTFRKEEEPKDPFLYMVDKTRKESEANFSMKLRVEATPDVLAALEIDPSSGNSFVGRGSGNIEINLSSRPSVFNINGDYTLDSGDYHFVALGVANKNFNIKKGSTIRFNGDIMESELDINASYTTKASISNLIADKDAASTRRNVQCGIRIADKIKNPSLKFSVDVPDLDPAMKARVAGALNTEDKVQKQFIALLVTNGFIPDDESGIVYNSSNILYSNMAEIMANQLNNILQKLDIPLDLGLSYQNNDGGTDIFDVAVSTELFNNRVVMNGSVGNRDKRKTASTNSSDLVGDLDIEIKLDNNGEVRMNLFSHSADEYTSYLDNSQRNGVGLTYQKEFDSFKSFFKNLFRRKKAEKTIVEHIEEVTTELE